MFTYEDLKDGRSDEELLKSKVMVGEKEILIKKMNNGQVEDFLFELSKMDFEDLQYSQLIEFIIGATPIVFGVDRNTFRQIDLEDMPVIIAHFTKKNKFFLKMLSKVGVNKIVSRIGESLGKVISNISTQLEEAEFTIEEKQESAENETIGSKDQERKLSEEPLKNSDSQETQEEKQQTTPS